MPGTFKFTGLIIVKILRFAAIAGPNIKVEVGSVAHPMLEEHHISFIYVETENGGIRVDLNDKPEAVISLGDEKAVAVYEYCNLHGLWKTEL